MPRGEYQPRHGEQSAEDRVKAALELLEQGIDATLNSESFAAYLRMMARMHHYSYGNLALIYVQRPTATLVAGYRRWQALGRQVKKGEAGIKILVPHKVRIKPENEEDEERVFVRSFGVGTVFDVSQTEGEPLPEPPDVQLVDGASDIGMRLYVDLTDYLGDQGVAVRREQLATANGYWAPGPRRIGIGMHIDGDQATKTLAHEAAHCVAEHGFAIAREDAETVAESAAFVVLNHYGLDSSGYTFPYVAVWARDRSTLKRNLEAIQVTSHRIIQSIEGGAPDHGGDGAAGRAQTVFDARAGRE